MKLCQGVYLLSLVHQQIFVRLLVSHLRKKRRRVSHFKQKESGCTSTHFEVCVGRIYAILLEIL